MSLISYENYMYFIAIVGNFSSYFQAYQLVKDRSSIKKNNPGHCSRIISYIWSVWICISWIIWAAFNQSDTVIISSSIALGGSILCVSIIFVATYSNSLRDTNKDTENLLVTSSPKNENIDNI
ncbi:MAG: hypothetical protein Terrestrivirus1_32 [Terrestrivirus sp.]|uniref:Uncharacterized protein n=1 Tax=Terrestrivirus sp. TaxID=2487775 RepID=A0A3G4ZJZ6_9VIRU|nr:MAG: hypothetical protein Terrestrivirus1_32 [Terrestrivirus sp.]